MRAGRLLLEAAERGGAGDVLAHGQDVEADVGDQALGDELVETEIRDGANELALLVLQIRDGRVLLVDEVQIGVELVPLVEGQGLVRLLLGARSYQALLVGKAHHPEG